jgi:hypothetical protein
MLPTSIRVFSIQFDIPLAFQQIPQWRGAIAEHVGLQDDRFHNHQGDKDRFHYRYPTVFYRSQQGKAAIWAFGDGTEALKDLLLQSKPGFNLSGQPWDLKVSNVDLTLFQPRMSANPQSYFLKNWLALNEFNFKRWENLPNPEAKMLFLEQILASNIIAFAKAIQWQLPERLEVRIPQITRTTRAKHKGILMLAFDVLFEANLFLPFGLGIGKAVSHGYGVVSRPLRNPKTLPPKEQDSDSSEIVSS